MSARYYEALAEVPRDHCLRLQLPSDIPVGPVRVAIIFEANPAARTIDTNVLSELRKQARADTGGAETARL